MFDQYGMGNGYMMGLIFHMETTGFIALNVANEASMFQLI